MEPAVPELPGVVVSVPLMLLGPDPTVPWVAGAPPPAVVVAVCAMASAGADKDSATTAAKIFGDISFLLNPARIARFCVSPTPGTRMASCQEKPNETLLVQNQCHHRPPSSQPSTPSNPQTTKSFLLLFFKKEVLSFFL
jgi:hypothetical protein